MQLTQHRLPFKLKKILRKWSAEEFPFLIFVPSIGLLTLALAAVRAILPTEKHGAAVFSTDPQRIEKVQSMRTGQLNYLITTTILERGVTFSKLNVVILGADEKTFSVSALVQIAGRVGRSKVRPSGEVIFICADRTKNVQAALKQIHNMNRKGRDLLHG